MADASHPQRSPDKSGLRRRRGSASSSLAQTARDVEHNIASTILVLWDNLPPWRRDNHFIISGYRIESNSYWRSFASLFYMHNESVNIWSHLIGCVTIPAVGAWLYQVITPRYASASSSDVLVFACFFAGAVLCLGMSALFRYVPTHGIYHPSFELKFRLRYYPIFLFYDLLISK